MQVTHRQPCVLDYFAPCRRDTARQCLERAELCSRLAKRARGQLRTKMYRLKDANIRAALRAAPEGIEIVADNDRYFGLLSVSLRGCDGVRVHTHENWMGAI